MFSAYRSLYQGLLTQADVVDNESSVPTLDQEAR